MAKRTTADHVALFGMLFGLETFAEYIGGLEIVKTMVTGQQVVEEEVGNLTIYMCDKLCT